ncbi:hypothetical protein VTN31DRAFT_4871 [Thermomyces dupontii]|uniref:uncharacterized protein n=1 Tax=Talaromyces thermophilus TaxID=28565 RepID=UPI003743F475
MPSSCKDIRSALAQCLQESDCVMVQRHSANDCIRPPLSEELPTRCRQLLKALSECKRGMVDMRKRFRGNAPISVSKDLESGQTAPPRQLYAGQPAFAVAKETDGNEAQMDPEKTRGL